MLKLVNHRTKKNKITSYAVKEYAGYGYKIIFLIDNYDKTVDVTITSEA